MLRFIASERVKQCKKIPVYGEMRYKSLACGSVVQRLPSCLEGICGTLYAFFRRGWIEQLALFVCRKRKVSRFLTNGICHQLCSSLCLVCQRAVVLYCFALTKRVIGAIMPLVPGIALTNLCTLIKVKFLLLSYIIHIHADCIHTLKY